MNIQFFSIFANKISIIGISLSIYLYFIYTFLPTYLYDPLTLFIPSAGVISYLLITKIRKSATTQQVVVQQNSIESQNVTPQTESVIDESLIQNMIEQKFSTIISEFNKTKQQLDDSLNLIKSSRGEMDDIKKMVNELKSAFDTTLVDLKAFQTEISNPLNFMRKYFESIDIKSFSDPLLPLHGEINIKREDDKKEDDKSEHNKDELEQIVSNSKISLADIMNLISYIGESMKIFKKHYREVLDTQLEILKPSEEERELLYKIVDILSRSKRPVDEYIDDLYRLATTLGKNDKNVKSTYARLKKRRRAK